MKEIDLWAGEPLLPTMEEPKREEIDLNSIMGNSDDFDLDFDDVLDNSSPDFGSNDYILEIKDRDIYLHSKTQITSRDILGIRGTKEVELKDSYRYDIYNNQFSSYALKHYLAGEKLSISNEDLKKIEEAAEKVPTPRVSITEDRKHAHINIFNHEVYVNLLNKVNGYPLRNTPAYRFNISRLLDFEAMAANLETKMPPIFFEKEALEVNREPIVGFDGTIESLKDISVGALNVVAANTQSNRNAQKSSKTLEEKMAAFGITTLHDLMFWLPKRYIDKSKPQDISDLIEGESSTIIGKVKSANDMPKNMGVAFVIETASGQKIESIFWRQTWLKNKFKEGSEVMLTGKLSFYRRPGQKPKPQFGGSSIEFSEEASILPIVPIYRQSEAKGITTAFLMAASRELLSRIKGLKLPVYLRQEDRVDYHTALTELHFPSSIENHKEAVASLAYYELVHMQLIMQEAKEKSTDRTGIEQEATPRKLQARAIKTLPFELTKSQKRAVVQMNKNISGSTPSSTLLSADVGSGKTLVAQLSALKSVDAGYQAILLGPTDILARQLYATLEKLVENIKKTGVEVNICYLSGGMKVREKKPLLKSIAEGEIDIIVGTHSVISDSMKYKNLGFVAIDEQQKFGASQRTNILNSREDGRIPDLLMMSATPIPRTTAQAYYGDMDIIELKEKPPGRLPIITEWIEEDPVEFTEQLVNKVWSDVRAEAAAGNQTFVITPMVNESDKIDAASVERTFKNLTETSLPDLRIGFAHGQMKPDEQRQAMQDFRDKKFDVLVASTVVEVGVDIPDATVVVVLSAERLGASSSHQIRGRVGRNSKQSKCYLVSLGKTENSRTRLQALVDNTDGFEIAKVDLKVRGEGQMFGTEQSGRSEMIFASLLEHGNRIAEARDEAKRILRSGFKDKALEDSRRKFEADERLF